MKTSKLARILFAAILVTTMVGCGKKTSEESVATAKAFIQSGQLDAAIIELKNAVQNAPEVPSTRLLLGQLNFRAGRLVTAEKELNKALELGSKVDDVLPLLSQVYYYSEQFDLASSLSVEGLTDSQALSTVSLMRYLASWRNRAGDTPLELEEVDAGLSELDRLLAQSYEAFRARDVKQSALLLQRLDQSNHRPVDIEFLLALLSNQRGDYASAAESFAKVNQLMSFTNSVNFQEIEALLRAKLFEDADKKVDVLLNINSENALLNLYKANIAYNRDEYELALGFAEKAIQNGADSSTARLIAGVSAYKLESFETAYPNLLNLSKRDGFQSDDVQRLLAHVQLSLGYNDDAANSLRIMTDLGNDDVDLFSQTGMKLAAAGDLSGAKELLAKASKLDDSNVSSKFREAMINKGTDENAVIDGLNRLLAQDPAVSQGWMQLAMAHVRNGDQKAALEVASQWIQTDPLNGKILEGVVYLNTNNTEQAISSLKVALTLEPKKMGAHQYLLQAYEKSKLYEELDEQARKILDFAPDNISALVAIANVGYVKGKRKEAEAYLKTLAEQNKDSISAYVALAVSAKLHREYQLVRDILEPLKEMTNPLGLMILGDVQLQLGDADLALSTYQSWKVKSPNALIPQIRMIGVYELKGDNERALLLTEEALEQFTRRPVLQLLKLNYLTKLKRFDAAKRVVDQIKSADGSETISLLYYFEGQLALGQKNYPEAEKLLDKHYKNSPSFTSAALLAKARQGNGHIGAGSEVLKSELAKLNNPSTLILHTVAEFHSHNGLYEDAAAVYSRLLDLEGKTAGTLNNLAYVLQKDKKLDRAVEFAKQAVVLAPNSPDILDTLGWIEYELGNLTEAYKHLTAALRLASNSNVIMLHLAQVQMALGYNTQAKILLNKLSKPTKDQQAKRRLLLDEI